MSPAPVLLGGINNRRVSSVAASSPVVPVTPDWETLRNFNSGPDGAATQGQADGFNGIAGNSRYSNEQVYSSPFSAKLTIAAGTTGFGNWGGSVSFPTSIQKGDTMWLQLYIWMPTNPTFIINTPTNGSLKYIRVVEYLASGPITGYFDLQFRDDGGSGQGAYRMLKEGQGIWQYFGGGTNPFPRGEWVRHTLCMKFDDVLPANGGTSRIRFWQNGVLLVDSTTTKTIINATDYAAALYLFTHWNGSAPQTQSLWVDDIRIAKNGVPTWVVDLL